MAEREKAAGLDVTSSSTSGLAVEILGHRIVVTISGANFWPHIVQEQMRIFNVARTSARINQPSIRSWAAPSPSGEEIQDYTCFG
jgi:hypothetical protein